MELAVVLHALMKTRTVLQMENLALRHQLVVLRRSTPKRLRLKATDRLFWIGISRLCADSRTWLVIVQPETVVRWHRTLFRAFWRWKIHHGKPGRPGVPSDTRELIRRMSRENPTWGAPRIHGELLKLGIEIAESSISKYLVRGRRPPSQTWRTFLQNHINGIGFRRLLHCPHRSISGALCLYRARTRAAADCTRGRDPASHNRVDGSA